MSDTPACHPAALFGTWKLRDAYAVDEAGKRLYDVYGASPTGFITYCPDGRMMALITHDGRAPLDGDRQSASHEQRAIAYSTSVAYAGTYRLDGDRVVHRIEASTFPNWVGNELIRRVRIMDNHVSLRTKPQMQNGVLTVIELNWMRLDAAEPALLTGDS